MAVRVDAQVETDAGTIFLSSERSDGVVLKYGQTAITVGDTEMVVNINELNRALEAIQSGTSMLGGILYNRNKGDIFRD